MKVIIDLEKGNHQATLSPIIAIIGQKTILQRLHCARDLTLDAFQRKDTEEDCENNLVDLKRAAKTCDFCDMVWAIQQCQVSQVAQKYKVGRVRIARVSVSTLL